MSDGPHRSLPMKRHWRDLAERAAKTIYSADEVAAAIPYALTKDLAEAPLSTVRDILDGGSQGNLFPDERIAQLEAARQACRGSATGSILIDCAIEAVSNGLSGGAAYRAALENTCDERVRSGFRTVEEHYQREASARSAHFVRARLDSARGMCNYGAIASSVMANGKPRRGSVQLPRQTGLDQGPPL